jgi:hypothetical protein
VSKHTQGEWRVLDNRDNPYEHGSVHVVSGGGLTVATITRQLVSEDGDERMANAALIAASPKLLLALRGLLTAFENIGGEHVTGLEGSEQRMLDAYRAIEDATGAAS